MVLAPRELWPARVVGPLSPRVPLPFSDVLPKGKGPNCTDQDIRKVTKKGTNKASWRARRSHRAKARLPMAIWPMLQVHLSIIMVTALVRVVVHSTTERWGQMSR